MIDGKGMWIWHVEQCENGSSDRIVAVAREAGLQHVVLKIADGGDDEYNVDVRPLVGKLQAAGIEVWGYQYIYGYASVEANAAVLAIRRSGVTGFVVDAEAEFKLLSDPSRVARAYMSSLRAQVGLEFPLALSSYRYPSYHPQFPWRAFLERCDLAMPQVYWLDSHNPAEQLAESLADYQKITKLPVIPTGAAWRQGEWEATAADVAEFLDAAKGTGFRAVNFWSWEHARRIPAWQVIAGYPWTSIPAPEPEPAPKPARVRVTANGLRVRSAPAVSTETVRFSARRGQTFDVEREQGDWVQVKLWMHKDFLEEP
jgi:hypothetical protein